MNVEFKSSVMKKAGVWLWIMLGMSLSTLAQTGVITVESEKASDVDFSKYETFNFASTIDGNLEQGLYFLDDLVFKNQIRDAVQDEMMGVGYSRVSRDPDLIVNFRVFDQPTKLKGSKGYGAHYWGNAAGYKNLSDTKTYDVKAGTLLISFVDRKNSQVVWQGFASGLIDNDRFIKDKMHIREAVNLIMNEYNERADRYSMQ
jgi:hypothetical protein